MTSLICAILLSGCWGLVPTAMGKGSGGAKLTIEQIANIQLDCAQKDYIIMVLEQQVGKGDVDPDSLSDADQKLNATARSKIWQLRTFCN